MSAILNVVNLKNESVSDVSCHIISSENTAKVIEIATKVKKDNSTRLQAEAIKEPSKFTVKVIAFFQWLLPPVFG